MAEEQGSAQAVSLISIIRQSSREAPRRFSGTDSPPPLQTAQHRKDTRYLGQWGLAEGGLGGGRGSKSVCPQVLSCESRYLSCYIRIAL